jgi:hypothetical protein
VIAALLRFGDHRRRDEDWLGQWESMARQLEVTGPLSESLEGKTFLIDAAIADARLSVGEGRPGSGASIPPMRTCLPLSERIAVVAQAITPESCTGIAGRSSSASAPIAPTCTSWCARRRTARAHRRADQMMRSLK